MGSIKALAGISLVMLMVFSAIPQASTAALVQDGALDIPDPTDPLWLSPAWASAQVVSVDNTQNNADLTDFQVRIEVPSLPGMKADYSDVRFTEATANVALPYWIEKSSPASAFFWVRVPYLASNELTSLFMYYQNPGAASESNGNSVFTFFDEFNGASVDLTKWQGDVGGFNAAGGFLRGTNTNFLLQSTSTFSNPIVIETRTKANVLATNGQSTLGFYVNSGDSIGLLEHQGGAPSRYWYRNNGAWNGPWDYDFFQWHNAKISIGGSGTGNLYVVNDVGAVRSNIFSNTVSNERISLGLRYDAWYSNQAYDQQWDWLFARKYAVVDPVAKVIDDTATLAFSPVLPMGSLVYEAEAADSIPYVNMADVYGFQLDPDQMFTALVEPAGGLSPNLNVYRDGLAWDSTSGTPGVPAKMLVEEDDSSHWWTLEVSGLGGTVGAYNMRVVLNADIEEEGNVAGADTNNNFGGAEDIADAFLTTVSGASRGAVLGEMAGGILGGRYDANGLPARIPPGGTAGLTQVSIPVIDSFTIADVNVLISLTHTWDSDLEIRLVGPGGSPTVILADNRGGSSDNYINTLFDDEAATAISAGAAPFTGSFRPDQSLTAFDGLSSLGTWTLQVDDQAGGDAGWLNTAYIIFNNINAYPARDFYMFPVLAGDVVDISAKLLSGTWIDIALFDPSQVAVVGAGVGGTTNVEESIRAYLSAASGDFFLLVRSDGEYDIVVTLNCHFNLEPNDPVGSAWWLSPTYRFALGHVTAATDNDVYRFDMVVGQKIDIWAFAPGFQAGEFVNTLRPTILVYNPAQVGVASETANVGEDFVELTYTPAETGTHYVLVGTGSGSGEYTLFVNRYPVANSDYVEVDEDSADNSIFPLVNDAEPDGDYIYISTFTQPQNGYVELVSDDEFEYTPDADYYGPDYFSYWVVDEFGAVSESWVDIDVANVQDAPVAENDEFRVWQDSVDNGFDVLDNDYDVDGDAIEITLVGVPQHGTAAISPDGKILYTPNPGYIGADTLTYTIDDGNGNTATGTVDITVVAKEPIAQEEIQEPKAMLPEKGGTGNTTLDVIIADTVLLLILLVLLVALFRRRKEE